MMSIRGCRRDDGDIIFLFNRGSNGAVSVVDLTLIRRILEQEVSWFPGRATGVYVSCRGIEYQ